MLRLAAEHRHPGHAARRRQRHDGRRAAGARRHRAVDRAHAPDHRRQRSTIASRWSSRASSTATCRRRSRRRDCSTRPIRPASAFCSMGGNVAENAGGPRAFKYGVTRDWTLGLAATLMGGETLRLGRRTPKGVTGYDLTALFVGSEGTFGVTSEITVRLVGPPGGRRDVHRRHARRGRRRGARSARSSARATGRARSSCSTSASIDHVRPKAAFTLPGRRGRDRAGRAGRRARRDRGGGPARAAPCARPRARAR